jgi:hypothetical protein
MTLTVQGVRIPDSKLAREITELSRYGSYPKAQQQPGTLRGGRQVTIIMSDRGIPRSFRHMHGFGSHTFSFINANNERNWVKFHFRTQQGMKT